MSAIPLAIVFTVSLVKGHPCPTWYNAKGKFSCKSCPEGTYFAEACTQAGGESVCVPCPNGTYQKDYNVAHTCEPCDDCTSSYMVGGIVDEPCTATSPTKCICPSGKYYSNETYPHGVCLNHSQCSPLECKKENGTAWHDTICGECPSVTVTVGESQVNKPHDPRRGTTTPPTVVQNFSESDQTDRAFDWRAFGAGAGAGAGVVITIILAAVLFAVCKKKNICNRKNSDSEKGKTSINTKADDSMKSNSGGKKSERSSGGARQNFDSVTVPDDIEKKNNCEEEEKLLDQQTVQLDEDSVKSRNDRNNSEQRNSEGARQNRLPTHEQETIASVTVHPTPDLQMKNNCEEEEKLLDQQTVQLDEDSARFRNERKNSEPRNSEGAEQNRFPLTESEEVKPKDFNDLYEK